MLRPLIYQMIFFDYLGQMLKHVILNDIVIFFEKWLGLHETPWNSLMYIPCSIHHTLKNVAWRPKATKLKVPGMIIMQLAVCVYHRVTVNIAQHIHSIPLPLSHLSLSWILTLEQHRSWELVTELSSNQIPKSFYYAKIRSVLGADIQPNWHMPVLLPTMISDLDKIVSKHIIEKALLSILACGFWAFPFLKLIWV